MYLKTSQSLFQDTILVTKDNSVISQIDRNSSVAGGTNFTAGFFSITYRNRLYGTLIG